MHTIKMSLEQVHDRGDQTGGTIQRGDGGGKGYL